MATSSCAYSRSRCDGKDHDVITYVACADLIAGEKEERHRCTKEEETIKTKGQQQLPSGRGI